MTWKPPLLGHKNWAATATLQGGSYQASWPLANLQDIRLAKVARTANALATSTLAIADLTVARPIRLIVITGHNLSASATIRIRGASTQANLTNGSALVDVTQDVWLGGMSPAANTAQDGRLIYTPTALVILPAAVSARWWRVDLADTGNADGWIEMGYLQLWEAMEFSAGIAYGASLAPETGTVSQETIGLVTRFDVRQGRRAATFVTNYLPLAEADAVLDLVVERGLHQPVFWLPEPSPVDPGSILRRSWLARLRTLTALEAAYWDGDRGGWSVVEIVG